MLTLKQRQERAARRAARIAAMHDAIRQAAAPQEPQHQRRSTVMKKHEVKVVRIKSAQRLRTQADKKAAVAAQVGAGAKPAADAAKDAKAAPAAAKGEATNPLEAHYKQQKDAAKAEKAAKVAAYRKEVAEKLTKPDAQLDAAVKASETSRETKKVKAAKPKGQRKPGILTLAADVLRDAKAPMDCKAIVEEVLAKGLWHTKGRTPAATLYAAIIREIAAKGKEARFHKTDRGMFELSAAARQ
jgi:hypothetical protein